MEKELIRDEGLRLRIYYDSQGVPSIGVGRNLRDVGISEAEASLFLTNDIDCTMRDLDANLPWWRNLDEVRQRALLNMAFNLGIDKLLKFRTTLGLIKGGMYDQAADAMMKSQWANQVGIRAKRLSDNMRVGTIITPGEV